MSAKPEVYDDTCHKFLRSPQAVYFHFISGHKLRLIKKEKES